MTRDITLERALEENEALRQIIREALPHLDGDRRYESLLERMRAAVGGDRG